MSQVITRVITFSLNLLIARHLPPQDYAVGKGEGVRASRAQGKGGSGLLGLQERVGSGLLGLKERGGSGLLGLKERVGSGLLGLKERGGSGLLGLKE